MKERSYHALIVKYRMTWRRGIKQRRGRGTFEKDIPMVMCYHQRNGRTVFDVSIHHDYIPSLVCRNVTYGSAVYTDEYVA